MYFKKKCSNWKSAKCPHNHSDILIAEVPTKIEKHAHMYVTHVTFTLLHPFNNFVKLVFLS